MHDVLLFSLQLVLGIAVPGAIVRRDIRRLPPAFLARAWPDTSVWIAVALVSPFAVLLHFARTRRTLRGSLLGVVWFAACLLVLFLSASLADIVIP